MKELHVETHLLQAHLNRKLASVARQVTGAVWPSWYPRRMYPLMLHTWTCEQNKAEWDTNPEGFSLYPNPEGSPLHP